MSHVGAAGIARGLTELGAGPVLYVLLGAACWATSPRRRDPVAWAPLGVLAAGQVVEAVVFAPLTPPGEATGAALDVSVSSGHACAAVVGWGLLARQLSGTRWRRPALALAVVVPPVVAATRVYLGVHDIGDVVLGLGVGVAVLVSGWLLLQRWTGAAGSTPDEPTATVASADRAGSPWWHGWPGWAVAVVAAAICVVPTFAESAGQRLGDLLVYRGAAETAGAGADVYGYRTPFGLPFTYPPFAALLAQPMARMPLLVVQAGWTALSLLAAVGVARVALRPVVVRLGLPITVAALLVTSPVRSHVHFGQVGLFLVLAVALDLLPAGGRRPGLGLGAAIAVKLTPAVYLPWLLLAGLRRRLALTCAWALGLTLLGLLLLYPSTRDYLTDAVFDSSRFGRNDIPGNQSIRGMLLRTPLSDVAVGALWLSSSVVVLAVATLSAVRLEREGNRLGAVGVLACLSVAVSPISWVHHLVWLAFPVAALVAHGRLRLAAAWWGLLVLSPPTLGTAAAKHVPELSAVWAVIVDLQGLTAVAGALALGRAIRRSTRVQPRGTPPGPGQPDPVTRRPDR